MAAAFSDEVCIGRTAHRMRLLVTPAEACDAWRELATDLDLDIQVHLTEGQVEDPDSLARLFGQVDAAILGLELVDGEVLARATDLKIISRFGVGYDAIDLAALKQKGIRLSNTPGCQYAAVARQTIAFLMAITFNLPDNGMRLKRGEWERTPNKSCIETVLGIVGMGGIGREVASLAHGLGHPVVAYSRSPFSMENVAIAESLGDLVQRSDVVSIHVPINAETRGMFSAELLGRMQRKSLINTARGGIASEAEVLNALTNGTLEYYAADVFEVEPVGGISKKLVEHNRVICTPHVAAMDPATARAMLKQALDNVRYSLQSDHEKVKSYVL